MSIHISDNFQCKRFQIAQNHEVFRVNSEAILLASWIKPIQNSKVLEIGSGTGIISIALAFRFFEQNSIDCIDIDRNAHALTQYNIDLNQCHSIKAFNLSLQEFSSKSTDIYDFIVSNPPFFAGNYKSLKTRNAISKYTDSLSFDTLLSLSKAMLSENGSIFLILPIQALEAVSIICQNLDLYIVAICHVAAKKGKNTNRLLLEISKTKSEFIQETSLFILNEKGYYTSEYKEMTQEFYTIF